MTRTCKCQLLLLFFLLVVIHPASAQSYDGYTLYFPQNGNKAYLLDLSGNNYHTWTFSMTTTYSTYLLANGVLLRTVNHPGNSFNGGPVSGEVQTVDWNGNVLWDFVYSTSDYCTHHDICPMPNGNVLLIAYERKTAAEAVQAGSASSIETWPDRIVEVQPSGTNGGTIVWEWHAWDHLVQDHDASKSNYGVVGNHPELLNINYNNSKDWMHVNGIDYNATLDQVTFSSHSLNEIYVIDHSTTTAQASSHSGGNSGKGGDLLYRWGNPQAYQAPGTADFNVVHDAHWVPMSSPRFPNALVGYNNKGGSGGKTCVDVINPPYDGYNYLYTPGSAYAPSTYEWRHTYSGNQSQDNGNSQQLPNGNMLICIGMSGFIYEIDSNQTTVWSKSVGGTIAQSFRYPPCYVNGTYTATAGADPSYLCEGGGSSQLDVSITGGVAYTYSWTSDPPGFTSSVKNPVVSPLVTTTYTVTVTNGPCSASGFVTITVNPAPAAPSITQSNDTLFSSAASGNQWFLNGTVLSGETNASLFPGENGSYQVRVTDQNNCESAMSEPFYVTWVGVSTLTAGEQLRIFPNPTTGISKVTGSIFRDKYVEISVLNSLGTVMTTLKNSSFIDLSSFENGIYFLSVTAASGTKCTKKIILIR